MLFSSLPLNSVEQFLDEAVKLCVGVAKHLQHLRSAVAMTIRGGVTPTLLISLIYQADLLSQSFAA